MSAARAASVFLALISVTLVTHLLTPSQYSLLAYVGIISSLMFTVTASWTSTAVTRYGREELEHRGVMTGTSWARITVTVPLALASIAFIAALAAAGLFPHEFSSSYVLVALGTGVSLIAAEHVVNLLEASGRMKLTATALALQKVTSIIGIGILAVLGAAHSARAIALIWFGMSTVLASVLAATVWRSGIWPPTFDRVLLRRLVKFSVPMIAFAVSQYVIGAVDIAILGAYRSAHEVGLYALAYQGYGVLQQIATTASIVLTPLFVSLHVASKDHVIQRFYRRMVPQVIFLASIAAGLGAPLLGIVVSHVFGAPFAPAATPLTLLVIAWLLYAATSFVASILVLHERARAIGLINVLAAIVNVLGDWLLIGVLKVGIVGPAIVTGVSLAIIATGYFYVAGHCVGTRPRIPVAMMAPAFTGVALSLALSGAARIVAAMLATLLTGAVVFVLAKPFAAQDIPMVESLDLPAALKPMILKGLGHLP